MLIFCSKHLEKSTFMFIFANKKELRTNWMIDEVRRSITPEMKLQMEMSVAIANRICDILEAKGMTQKELARKLGKTETEVSRWLSGTHNLTLSTISKVSVALGEDIVIIPERKN